MEGKGGAVVCASHEGEHGGEEEKDGDQLAAQGERGKVRNTFGGSLVGVSFQQTMDFCCCCCCCCCVAEEVQCRLHFFDFVDCAVFFIEVRVFANVRLHLKSS